MESGSEALGGGEAIEYLPLVNGVRRIVSCPDVPAPHNCLLWEV